MGRQNSIAAKPDTGWKILCVGDEVQTSNFVRTLLNALGCKCSIASNEEQALALIEREIFDAIVLVAPHFESSVEDLILRVREARPDLSRRILEVSGGVEEPAPWRMVERYGLLHVPREQLIQRLWSTLQEAFSSIRLLQVDRVVAHLAEMVFDSFQQPVQAGVRGFHQSVRQFVYKYSDVTIDLHIEPLAGVNRISLTGQVVDPKKPVGRLEGVAVYATSQRQALAQTVANRFGEFALEFDSNKHLGIEIRIEKGFWVLVPLEDVNWARGPNSKS